MDAPGTEGKCFFMGKIIKRIKNFVRNINYLTKHSLWDQREEDIVYLTNKILDDSVYEFGQVPKNYKQLTILSPEDTFELIKNHPKSFVRTGDGEVKLMKGMDQPFQKYEKEIADRLTDMLEHPREDLYVGINRNYFISLLEKGNPEFYRRWAYEYRTFYREHCAADGTYIDSTFTSLNGETSREKQEIWYEKWKDLFAGRDIVVVCGEGILDKLEHDIFERAKSKRLIQGPRISAWDKHDELIHEITATVRKDQVLVFILGMAGKAMIPELTDMGYLCWDVGHLAKYYNAYMTNMEWTQENTAKFYAPD